MAGAFSGPLNASASTLVFALLGVSFCILTSCTPHHPEMGFCLSRHIRGDGFLMPLRSLSRSSNDIISKFCCFLGPTRELLGPLLPEQLLGTAQHLAYKLTACLQIDKELAATKDQMDVLTAERDSTLAAPLLNSKIKSLTQELELTEGEHLSVVARMKEVEETAMSLEGKQTALDEAEAAVDHWHGEWKSLAAETGDMVRHLNSTIDYSMITLDTRWDPKARRIYSPKAEAQEQTEPTAEGQFEPAVEVQPDPVAEVQPEVEGRSELPEESVEGVALGEGGGCPT
ncbi:hypothetical protein PIB30_063018 [Stylosanthes scabra]|uniref:Uncharacterized protein n=1 Tax=Stylosanthes scabra TaxID=79078 RepID=A0ABU6YN57_9FABA|nr:hypothetical protein [Stylosanthes scabra]